MDGHIAYTRLLTDGTHKRVEYKATGPVRVSGLKAFIANMKSLQAKIRHMHLKNIIMILDDDDDEGGIKTWTNILKGILHWADVAELKVEGLTTVNKYGDLFYLAGEEVAYSKQLRLVKPIQRAANKVAKISRPRGTMRGGVPPPPPYRPPRCDKGSLGNMIREPRYKVHQHGFWAVGHNGIHEALDEWIGDVKDNFMPSAWCEGKIRDYETTP